MLFELGTDTSGRVPMVGFNRSAGLVVAYLGAGVLTRQNQEQPVDEGLPIMQSSQAIT